jgi:hypothetical protein
VSLSSFQLNVAPFIEKLREPTGGGLLAGGGSLAYLYSFEQENKARITQRQAMHLWQELILRVLDPLQIGVCNI